MAAAVPARAAEAPRFAVTIDDFRFDDGPLMSGSARHRAILDALSAAGVQAAGLVTGKHVANTAGQLHLGSWAEAGHAVGNHTFDHAYHGGSAPGDLGPDIDLCAQVLPRTPALRPWFRFPYLAEGRTAEVRDRMRADLAARGLMNAHVTIDASDWYVNQRLLARLEREPGADVTPYGDYLVQHLLDRAAFYDGLARDVLGRSPAHTLLIHHNLTTALFLPRILKAFAGAGWAAIDADEAFADPVFAALPDIAPCAHSLIHQLAKADGRFDDRLRYPGEDGPYEAPAMDALGL
ncbi:MAG: polysaccharide deacetylase family protein [Alphaproteobacteria bacterium]|nr:polysaccharide deacetylase family protein [Alphaproteobacteria bacterium]MBU1525139.1 polysaccharide deacetylase family protein [Alphaproteobacteria bacterium]MBU2117336.1 polysaccharide deacetylase family protein [Alphaproteobacteria bacterium]MBU2350947.1 polysaccharide deacetylase family protein [Alphaproteobacteria bacterium]MBU2383470.1 polysaccharide deacetylase family protein [Alphaproteobacteria bacterium]